MEKEAAERLARLNKSAKEIVASYTDMGVPMQRAAADPANPWSQNAFDPFHGPGGIHRRRRRPSPIPDSRLLFDIQRDLVNALSAFRNKDYDGAEIQVQNAYRVTNRYLRTYVTMPEDSGGIIPDG